MKVEGQIQFQLQLVFNRLDTNRYIYYAAIVLCKSLNVMCGEWSQAELCFRYEGYVDQAARRLWEVIVCGGYTVCNRRQAAALIYPLICPSSLPSMHHSR